MTTTTTKKRTGAKQPHEAAAEFVRGLVSRYTKFPEALEVTGGQLGPQIMIALRAHRDDQPRLVGSQGRNIVALQGLARGFGAMLGHGLKLTLLEPTVGEKLPRAEFKPDPEWQPAPTKRLLGATINHVSPETHTVAHSTVGDLSFFEIKPAPVQDLVSALHTIFHAIGRNEGRLIEVLGHGQAGN